MFEQLLSLVQENAGTAIIDNDAIPNERNNEAIETATHSISDTFKSAIQSGNVSDVMQMFGGNSSNVSSMPLTQNMHGNLVDNLMNKFGLSNSQAGGIASSILPAVLGNLVHKTNDPADSSFDISSILSNLGGSGFDVGSVLSKFGMGGGSQGGGITDALKNIFGK